MSTETSSMSTQSGSVSIQNMPVDQRLQMAVNHAVNDLRIARARMGLLNPGMGLDQKRFGAWCEYGFKEELEFRDFYNLFRRGGIAHGAVNKIVQTCWSKAPQIIEGDDQDRAEDVTPWENRLKPIFKRGRFWRAFAEADRRRLVGRYSALLLRVRDSGRWEEPIKRKGAELVDIIPVWSSSLQAAGYNQNREDQNYGKVTKWHYTEASVGNSAGRRLDVHPDRLFILGDYTNDAIGFLEPAYNNFVSLEKVEGGSGESFLKNAARQLSINFDKDADLAGMAAAYNVPVADLQEIFDKTTREMNMGNDASIITQGGSVTPLVASIPDPTPTYNVNLQSAAAALDVPTKILVGMQTGERASTEDQKYFNARCQSRRTLELNFEISDLIEHLMRIWVVDRIPEFTVLWDDLNEPTRAERLANAKTASEINAQGLSTGELYFDNEEVRELAGYDPAEGDALKLPDTDPDDDIEDGDPKDPPAGDPTQQRR